MQLPVDEPITAACAAVKVYLELLASIRQNDVDIAVMPQSP